MTCVRLDEYIGGRGAVTEPVEGLGGEGVVGAPEDDRPTLTAAAGPAVQHLR